MSILLLDNCLMSVSKTEVDHIVKTIINSFQQSFLETIFKTQNIKEHIETINGSLHLKKDVLSLPDKELFKEFSLRALELIEQNDKRNF